LHSILPSFSVTYPSKTKLDHPDPKVNKESRVLTDLKDPSDLRDQLAKPVLVDSLVLLVTTANKGQLETTEKTELQVLLVLRDKQVLLAHKVKPDLRVRSDLKDRQVTKDLQEKLDLLDLLVLTVQLAHLVLMEKLARWDQAVKRDQLGKKDLQVLLGLKDLKVLLGRTDFKEKLELQDRLALWEPLDQPVLRELRDNKESKGLGENAVNPVKLGKPALREFEVIVTLTAESFLINDMLSICCQYAVSMLSADELTGTFLYGVPTTAGHLIG